MDQKWTLPHKHHAWRQAQTHYKNTQRTAYQQQNITTELPSSLSLGTGLNKNFYNMNIANTTKCPACDYETETVTHFIGQCPAYSQIRADYSHTYHSNTDDIFNKQSLTRIVGYALRQKGSRHRMKKTSRALHKILGLCNL